MLPFDEPRRDLLRTQAVAWVIAIAAVIGWALPSSASATTLPSGFSESTMSPTDWVPTAVDWTPDGAMLLADKRGRVFRAPAGETIPAAPFLDLTAKVNDNGDRGMLDIEVDVDYETNGFVYLLYVAEMNPLDPDSGGPMTSRLTRIQFNPDGSLANPANPETVILGKNPQGTTCPAVNGSRDCIPADYIWHSIGTVRSDPSDGTLWVGSGDARDPEPTNSLAFRTFDPNSPAGKIMHVDRQGQGLPGHPFCPGVTDLTQVCTKVHAMGFRNPFRFSLGPDGNPVVGDVGWGGYEEVNVAKPGQNYGWPCYEGPAHQPLYTSKPECVALYAKEGTAGAATPPDWSYPHGGGASVIVGPSYEGGDYPSRFDGKVFIADYVQGWIKLLDLGGAGVAPSVEDFATSWPAGVDLELNPAGNLAYVDIGFNEFGQPGNGAVRQFDYQEVNRPPAATATATPATGPAPLVVSFDGSSSTDPDGDSLTYRWTFGDGSAPSTATAPTHTYGTPGIYTARLTVEDGNGGSATDDVTIQVGSPPTARIDDSVPRTFRAGDPVALSGTGTDGEDGELSGSSLRWTVTLVHGDDHTHPQGSLPTGRGPITFTTQENHGHDSYYRVTLTATDSDGLTHSDSIRIDPETVRLRVGSEPSGAPLVYGDAVTTGVDLQEAIGYSVPLAAAPSFTSGGVSYVFDRWSNGGGREQQFKVPATETQLTASYIALDTNIVEKPAELSRNTTATFTFSSSIPSATFECRRDASTGAFTACSTPYVWSGLSDGTHTLDVRAVAGGAADTTPARFTFKVDTIAPQTTIGSGPANGSISSDRNPSFGFSSSKAGSSFECKLDGPGATTAAYTGCSSPRVYSNLANGIYLFSVRATDSVGNVDGSAATRSFTVDGSPPETTIASGPASGSVSANRNPSFGFSSSEGGSSFQCKLDGPGATIGSYSACTSPRAFSSLPDGGYTFSVRAIDPAANVDASPATRSFAIDATPPETTISSGPANGSISSDRNPSFGFGSNEAGASFQCKLDGPGATIGSYSACTSPRAFSSLPDGGYTFSVRAIDPAANVDPSPAARSFSVQQPATTFTLGQPVLDRTRGTAKLPVTVPGPGLLELSGEGIRDSRTTINAAGTVQLDIVATGRFADRLLKRGEVAVTAIVSFTPTGGARLTKEKRITLIRSRQQRRR